MNLEFQRITRALEACTFDAITKLSPLFLFQIYRKNIKYIRIQLY